MRSIALAGLGGSHASPRRHADSGEKLARGTAGTAVVEGQHMTATSLPINGYIAAESKSPTPAPAESSPCSALARPPKELLDFSVSAEKFYWLLMPITFFSRNVEVQQ